MALPDTFKMRKLPSEIPVVHLRKQPLVKKQTGSATFPEKFLKSSADLARLLSFDMLEFPLETYWGHT